MAAKKTSKTPAQAPAASAAPETSEVLIRHLTPEDMAAIERMMARRQRRMDALSTGVKLSRNAAMLSFVREALAAEDAADPAASK